MQRISKLFKLTICFLVFRHCEPSSKPLEFIVYYLKKCEFTNHILPSMVPAMEIFDIGKNLEGYLHLDYFLVEHDIDKFDFSWVPIIQSLVEYKWVKVDNIESVCILSVKYIHCCLLRVFLFNLAQFVIIGVPNISYAGPYRTFLIFESLELFLVLFIILPSTLSSIRSRNCNL